MNQEDRRQETDAFCREEKSAFPDGFLWSASTSAYQFEGAAAEGGKGPSIQDVKENTAGDFRVAMDHYHRYRDDIRLLGELGLKGYRFSIAWTRIMPHGKGAVNEEGLAFYRDLIRECRKYNIAPVATIYHDDLPYALYKEGGWKNRATIGAFEEYCLVLFEHFGDDVAYWQPICEQNLLTIEKIAGQKEALSYAFQENHHMFLAQARAVKLFRDLGCKGKIGPALNLVSVYPASSSAADAEAARYMDMMRNLMYLDVAVYGKYPPLSLALLKRLDAVPVFEEEDEGILQAGVCDMICCSNYTSVCVTAHPGKEVEDNTGMKYGFNLPGLFKIVPNMHLGYTPFAPEVDPVGTRLLLLDVYNRYQKPIFIIERSLGLQEELAEDGRVHDAQRIRYLQLQVEQLKLALEAGVGLIGFCTWSAFDVISTNKGVDTRYGLIFINRGNSDRRDLRRVPKDSYYWFQDLIASNGRIRKE